jgi:hypothetical protein
MLGSNYFLVYYSMGLDPNFTSGEIQRIETDANNADKPLLPIFCFVNNLSF